MPTLKFGVDSYILPPMPCWNCRQTMNLVNSLVLDFASCRRSPTACPQYTGKGFDAYTNFLSSVAELHSIEISCLSSQNNYAKSNPRYQKLVDQHRLHCGDASNLDTLHDIWKTHMNRPDAPPLKVVLDDASHYSSHMVTSIFFWFPRIEPGGMMIVEDIQPIQLANLFRTQFLPQLMADLHFCGDPNEGRDEACFPQLYPLLHSIHCEMHICILERNQAPAIPDLSLELSAAPSNALNLSQCYTFAHPFGQ